MRRAMAILALAGASLTLVQYGTMREFASLIGSNELVLLLVVAAYFLGLSFGYLLSDRLGERALAAVGFATLALQATLPFSARWLAATMSRINLAGNTPPLLFLLVLAGVTPFYAVFLPRLVDTGRSRAPLGTLYAVEIGGALAGLVIVVVLSPARMAAVFTAHLAALVALLGLHAGPRWKRLAPLALIPPAYAAAWSSLDASTLAHTYRHVRELRDPKVIASEFSPYQRVDLVEAGSERSRSVRLYLNGNLLYGGETLHQHNLMVSILPNLVVGPRSRAVVIGGGSLDSARYLAPRVEQLRVVEIDETVVRLARRHIQEPRGAFPANWELVIDDGKHFLGTWRGAPFDVIAIDVPVPTHLQTAMLHSERFFGLAREKLAPGGLFSIALSGRFHDLARDEQEILESHLANRVVAGLLARFPHVTIVRADRRDFAWASDAPLPLTLDQIERRLREFLALSDHARVFGTPTLELLDPATVRRWAVGVPPIGEADMQVVLRLSLSKLYHRYYDPND